MSTRVEIHPTAKIAAYALGGLLLAVLTFLGIKRLTSDRLSGEETSKSEIVASDKTSQRIYLTGSPGNPLVPVLEIEVADTSREANWSDALAKLLHGQTEMPVEGGRVDVLTDNYAIEVDRLDKWHEGIGQAAHYGMLTKSTPVVALIVPSDDWPLSNKTLEKLLLIDKTCTAQNVKLILLRRGGGVEIDPSSQRDDSP